MQILFLMKIHYTINFFPKYDVSQLQNNRRIIIISGFFDKNLSS